MSMEIELKATAGPNGEITLYTHVDGVGLYACDLNYLLKTKLYREGYPKTEENRLKNSPSVRYDHKK